MWRPAAWAGVLVTRQRFTATPVWVVPRVSKVVRSWLMAGACARPNFAGSDETRTVSFQEERSTQIAVFKRAVRCRPAKVPSLLPQLRCDCAIATRAWPPSSPFEHLLALLAFRHPSNLDPTHQPSPSPLPQVAMLLEEYYNSGDLNEAAVSLQVCGECVVGGIGTLASTG